MSATLCRRGFAPLALLCGALAGALGWGFVGAAGIVQVADFTPVLGQRWAAASEAEIDVPTIPEHVGISRRPVIVDAPFCAVDYVGYRLGVERSMPPNGGFAWLTPAMQICANGSSRDRGFFQSVANGQRITVQCAPHLDRQITSGCFARVMELHHRGRGEVRPEVVERARICADPRACALFVGSRRLGFLSRHERSFRDVIAPQADSAGNDESYSEFPVVKSGPEQPYKKLNNDHRALIPAFGSSLLFFIAGIVARRQEKRERIFALAFSGGLLLLGIAVGQGAA